MRIVKKTCGACVGLILTALCHAAIAQTDVTIPEVPQNATPTGGNEEATLHPGEGNADKDYQNDVLTNPQISQPARAESVMKANGFDGNTAVVVQNGKSNKSSVTQSGKDNSASQTQNGNSNDLRVEQNGDHNSSQEEQIGNYNHKVKIQNGNRQEETTIEQAGPEHSE